MPKRASSCAISAHSTRPDASRRTAARWRRWRSIRASRIWCWRHSGRVAVASPAAIAALLGERDIVKASPAQRDADLRWRVELLQGDSRAAALPRGVSLDRGALDARRGRPRANSSVIFGGGGGDSLDPRDSGRVLALAYPDRIAQRRAGSHGAVPPVRTAAARHLPRADPLASEEFLAVADLDGDTRDARIFLAAPSSRADIEEDFAADHRDPRQRSPGSTRATPFWRAGKRRLGALVLKDEPLPKPRPNRSSAAMLDGIRALGIAALPWTREARKPPPAHPLSAPSRRGRKLARSVRRRAAGRARGVARALYRRHHATRRSSIVSISPRCCGSG